MKSINQFFLFAFAIFIVSCKDNADHTCLAIMNPAILDFRIVDEKSGTDLFFSENAPFGQTKLTLKYRIRDTLFQTLNVRTITSDNNQYFSASLPLSTDTVFMRIDNLPIDTITYSTVISKNIPCSTYELESLQLNKTPVALENKNPVVFKKRALLMIRSGKTDSGYSL